jgi:hypothetical protein
MESFLIEKRYSPELGTEYKKVVVKPLCVLLELDEVGPTSVFGETKVKSVNSPTLLFSSTAAGTGELIINCIVSPTFTKNGLEK